MKKYITSVLLLSLFCHPNSGLHAQERLYHNEFPLQDVVLLNGPFKTARDLNIKTLLQYNVDRLLAPYLTEAGLQPKDSSYPNWEGLDGHVGGHYLSALAMNTAATGNADCKQRMLYMVSELKRCSEAHAVNHPDWGKGYTGGVPHSDSIWSSFRKGDFTAFYAAWVPWYNVHKLYAGLRDVWLYTGNVAAKNLFLSFCDWAIFITKDLSEAQMQSMLNTEQGGMNEVLADAYEITGDTKYLAAAKRFSHHMLLEPMAKGVDNLDNKHANTQVPKAIGFARIGELSGDEIFTKAGNFFWQTVTTNRTLAFGGNSRREFFPSAAACTDFLYDVEGPESCNSYNMLKLTEDLFRKQPNAKYIDFYERNLYNHILSTQHPETGGYVYFTPARPRSYRVYSAPNEAMWCCVGSGMENHGKYNQFIYTHNHDSLFVNLFVASQLTWKEKGIQLKQETKFPFEDQTKLTLSEVSHPFTLFIRYPGWVSDGALTILVNGKAVSHHQHPASFVALTRDWKKGDVIEVKLPMHNSIEPLPNVPDYVAILHGPVLLAAKTGTEDMKGLIADDSRWGHIPSGKKMPLNQAPVLICDNEQEITNNLTPVPGKPLHYKFKHVKMENAVNLTLQPFYQIYDARYMMYWMALSNDGYKSYLDSLAKEEKDRMDIDNRTVDAVTPGEQQPEADHAMQNDQSRPGTAQDRIFREASNEGYFSYRMTTNGEENLSLMVRYWGAEWGNRTFNIYIDDQKLTTENNSGRWNQSRFFDIAYSIPGEMLKDKQSVRIKFEAAPGASVSPVYHIRLLRNK